MNWFSTGYDEMDTIPDGSADDRHYLKKEQDALVIFLDGSPTDQEMFQRNYGAPFCVWEYQIPTKGPEDDRINWRNWATCTRGRKGPDGEPLVDFVKDGAPDLKAYYVGFFSLLVIPKDVDLDRHIKSGEPLPESCRKILLPAKRKLLGVLKRHMNRRDGLRGCVYLSYRTDAKSISTGDQWEYEEKLSEQDIKSLLPDGRDVPLEYPKLLEPLGEEAVNDLLKIRTKVGGYGDSNNSRRGDSGRNQRDGGGDRDRDRGRDRGGRDRDRGGYDRDRDGRGRGRNRDRDRGRNDGYNDNVRDDVGDPDVPF